MNGYFQIHSAFRTADIDWTNKHKAIQYYNLIKVGLVLGLGLGVAVNFGPKKIE